MGLQLEPPWRLSIPACVGLPVAAALRLGQEPNVKAPAPNPPKPASANSKPNTYPHHRLAHAEDRDRALQGPLPTFPITRLPGILPGFDGIRYLPVPGSSPVIRTTGIQ